VTLGSLAGDNHGKGEAISLELGKSSIVGHGLTLTPQIQMAYQNVSFDAFSDPFDTRVSLRKGDSLKTRWGIYRSPGELGRERRFGQRPYRCAGQSVL
jgi:fibronectin-binding autotransporter adhesin